VNMAITHKCIAMAFMRGWSVKSISILYGVPSETVENAVRVHLKRDFYSIPEQLTIDNKEQLTIAEVYGEITV
jgi:hypothetical protein